MVLNFETLDDIIFVTKTQLLLNFNSKHLYKLKTESTMYQKAALEINAEILLSLFFNEWKHQSRGGVTSFSHFLRSIKIYMAHQELRILH